MSATFDDHFDDHPKYAECNAAEMGLISCAITYANRNLTDGVIPRVWPERRFGKEGPRVAKELVKRGIWRQTDDGRYEIVGFLDHNPSRAEILADRARAAEAKSKAGHLGGIKSGQARRARILADSAKAKAPLLLGTGEPKTKQVLQLCSKQNEADIAKQGEAKTNENEARSDLIRSDLPPTPLASDEPPSGTLPRAAAPTDPMGDGEIASAWAEGVRLGSGSRITRPTGAALRRLLDGLGTHGPTRQGPFGSRDVARYAKERGEAYGAAKGRQSPNPFHFVDWLDGGHGVPDTDATEPPIEETPVPPRVSDEERLKAIEIARKAGLLAG